MTQSYYKKSNRDYGMLRDADRKIYFRIFQNHAKFEN